MYETISMKIKSEQLIRELLEITRKNINYAESLKVNSTKDLNWREGADRWSVLECLEHLNLYGDFYIPEIKKVIQTNKTKPAPIFKSGLLGNYFAEGMLPKQGFKKMTTFKGKNPLGSNLNRKVIQRFINQQVEMTELLNKASSVDLNKVKTAISITRLLKLKLGDTFRVVINHNIRHMEQVKNVLDARAKVGDVEGMVLNREWF